MSTPPTMCAFCTACGFCVVEIPRPGACVHCLAEAGRHLHVHGTDCQQPIRANADALDVRLQEFGKLAGQSIGG